MKIIIGFGKEGLWIVLQQTRKWYHWKATNQTSTVIYFLSRFGQQQSEKRPTQPSAITEQKDTYQ